MKKEKNIELWKKIVILFLLSIYMYIGYFFCQSITFDKVYDATFFIDDITPFIPSFMIFYNLGYLLILAPAIMIKDKKEFYVVSSCFFMIMTISFAVFLALPIEIIRPVPTGDDVFSKAVLLQQSFDSGFNTFPSLHVSQDLFSFLIMRDKNRKLGNYLIPIIILIIFSTMFVKQHNFIDIIGGVLLASFAFWLYKRKTSDVSSKAK